MNQNLSAKLPMSGSQASFESMLLFVVIWLGFYLIFIRPQKLKLRQRSVMQSELKVGDWVLLQSGMYAYITDISEKIIEVVSCEKSDIKSIYHLSSVVQKLPSKPEFTK